MKVKTSRKSEITLGDNPNTIKRPKKQNRSKVITFVFLLVMAGYNIPLTFKWNPPNEITITWSNQ